MQSRCTRTLTWCGSFVRVVAHQRRRTHRGACALHRGRRGDTTANRRGHAARLLAGGLHTRSEHGGRRGPCNRRGNGRCDWRGHNGRWGRCFHHWCRHDRSRHNGRCDRRRFDWRCNHGRCDHRRRCRAGRQAARQRHRSRLFCGNHRGNQGIDRIQVSDPNKLNRGSLTLINSRGAV